MSFIPAHVLEYALTQTDARGRVVLAVASAREPIGLKVSEIMTLTDLGERAVQKAVKLAESDGLLKLEGLRWVVLGARVANSDSLGLRTAVRSTCEQVDARRVNGNANENSGFQAFGLVFDEKPHLQEASTGVFNALSLSFSSSVVSSSQDQTTKTKTKKRGQKKEKVKLTELPADFARVEPNEILVAMPGFSEAWQSFLVDRLNRGKDATLNAQKIQLGRLVQWHTTGFDPVLIVQDSVAGEWQGLYCKAHHKYGYSPPESQLSPSNTSSRKPGEVDLKDKSRYQK